MGAHATVTSKGQMTIPQSVREALGLMPGDRIDVEVMPDGSFRAQRVSRELGDLIGRLSAFAGARPVGPDDIEAARAAEYAGRRGTD